MRNIKISIVRFFFLGFAMLMLGAGNVLAQVSVSLPDITRQSGAPDEFINLTVGNLTGQNVKSYQFTITYNKDIVELTEVDDAGTLSAGGLLVPNADVANGTLSVAFAKATALSGEGTLLKIKVKFKATGTTVLDFGTSFLFNTGTPAANVTDGNVIIPSIAVGFSNVTANVGETVLLAVSTSEVLEAQNVFSYQFVATFNPAVLEILDVVTTGTLSAGGLPVINPDNNAGTVSVAWARATKLSGTGTLIYLQARVIGAGTSTNAFSSFQYNSGNPGAGTISGVLTASDIPTFTISGTVTYNNSGSSPVAGVAVILSGDASDETTTDAVGAYSFSGLLAGNYIVAVTKTAGWGGVNSTDALLAQRAFLNLTTLDAIQQLAGDVTDNGAVNSTDAQDIMRRYLNIISAFTKPDWVFLPQSENITITNANATNNIKALATGDINASLVFSSPKVSPLNLISGKAIEAAQKKSVDVPVSVNEEMIIGAASLRFTYPADLLKFEGVSGKINYTYKDNEGVVTLAWADLTGGKNAVKVSAGDVIASLKFSALDKGQASFNLGAGSEFADAEGNVYKGSVTVPSVNISAPKEFQLNQNYPNPFNPSTKIDYTIPENGNVTITIYNVTGQEITKLVNEVQGAGSYQAVWSASNLSSGIYFYKLNFEGTNRSYSDIKSMILLK